MRLVNTTQPLSTSVESPVRTISDNDPFSAGVVAELSSAFEYLGDRWRPHREAALEQAIRQLCQEATVRAIAMPVALNVVKDLWDRNSEGRVRSERQRVMARDRVVWVSIDHPHHLDMAATEVWLGIRA